MLFTTEVIEDPELYEIRLPATTGTNVWPFPGTERAWFDRTALTRGGVVTSDYCNDVWGSFAAKNLGPTTSFSFFIRAGFECQVQPGTVLTSHQMLSPKYDRGALDTYFMISREMKDAYPADYNEEGKILGTIARIAKTVSPYLGMVPGIGGILSPLASGVGSAASALDSLFNKEGQKAVAKANADVASGEYGKLLSAADKESAKRVKAQRALFATAQLDRLRRQIGQRKPKKAKKKGRKAK